MRNNKVVYIHRKSTNGEIFYVGMGNKWRPYDKSDVSRSHFWHRVVKKYGHKVEVIRTGLSRDEAYDIEIDLIQLIGRRDKRKGTLVNLTDGGGGSSNDSVKRTTYYNIETGEKYNSLLEASADTGIPRTTLRDNFNGRASFNQDIPIRDINNPYPEDKLPIGIEYIEDNTEECYNFSGDMPIDFNDEEQELLDRINELPYTQKELLEESYDRSIREIADEYKVGRMYVHRNLKKAREFVLGDDIEMYKNKALKHLKGA